MNEVTIPLKLTGIAAIKAELRSLKDQLADATDPETMSKLADRAGELQQKLIAINKQIGEFNKGSNLDQVQGAFQGLSMSIEEMNFSKASKEAANLNQSIKALKPADLTKQMKGFASTVANLGKTFVSLGTKLLTNPMFFLTAIIAGIVAAIVIFLKNIGFLEKAFDVLMIPINGLIKLFKKLTDTLGLTQYGAEENAKAMAKANDKAAESSKKRAEKVSDAYDLEIAKAKAAGKDTTQLETAKSKALSKEAESRLKNQQREYAHLQKISSKDNLERRKKLREQIEAEKAILKEGRKERQLIEIQADKEAADKAKENASKAKETAKANAEKAKAYAKNRLDAERTIKDIEISLIANDTEREIATINEKYARLIEDTKKNENLIGSEKVRLTALYEAERIAELDKNAKLLAEQEAKRQAQIAAGIKAFNEQEAQNQEDIQEQIYQLGLTEQQRELEANQYKYDALIAQAERYGEDTKLLLDTQLAEETKIKKKYSEEEEKQRLASIAKAQAERDAKLALTSDIVNGIGALGNAFIKDQKKLENFNKASALIQIGIDTAKAISSLVAASQANPANAVTGGIAGITQFASGILQITTNIAKAKQLLSSPSSTVSGGGGGGGGTSSTSVSAAIPTVSLFGQGNNLNTAGQPKSVSTNQNITVTAVVSETDITSTQNKIDKIKKGSEL